MESQWKEVRFDVYCAKCEYREKEGKDNPCCDCLGIGSRENSHIPEFFKGDKGESLDEKPIKRGTVTYL